MNKNTSITENILFNYGWNDFFENSFKNQNFEELNYIPARVTKESKNQYWLMTENGEKKATISTKLFMNTFAKEHLPVVGDWVAIQEQNGSDDFFIEGVLERKTKLIRKGKDSYGRNFEKAGDGGIRIISSNIDTVFYVASLDHRDFNLTKIERYLMMLYDCGAKPVLILNKKDICPEYEEYVEQLQTISGDLPIHCVSAIDFDGIEELLDYLEEGQTVAFIGSSGVGKSSIVNALMGKESMYVSDIREDDKRGKHTTTHREMIMFPDGGILIDNPGIRDLKPVASVEALESTFDDIIELMEQCKFSNCSHHTEPGCGILEAIDSGKLDPKRYQNYLNLKRESDFFTKRAKQREYFLEKAAKKEKKGGAKIKKHMKGCKRRDDQWYE